MDKVKIHSKVEQTQTLHILIVDDDPDFLDLLWREFSLIPCVQVVTAGSVHEAVNKLGFHDFELVVSDWALDAATASDVFSIADLAKLRTDKIPILLISGSQKFTNIHNLHGLQNFIPVSFVLKSCGPTVISRLAERLLDRFYPERYIVPQAGQF